MLANEVIHMDETHIVIDTNAQRFEKREWVKLLRYVEGFNDFYQLLALSIQIESRIHKIKPSNVQIEYPFFKELSQNEAKSERNIDIEQEHCTEHSDMSHNESGVATAHHVTSDEGVDVAN